MANYDDFGRPIYETAEEYNKARKTGGMQPTYESPEGDAYKHVTMKERYRNESAATRYANHTNSKKAKSLIIGVVAFILAMNIVIIFSMVRMVKGTYEEGNLDFDEIWVDVDDDNDNDNDEGYGEYLREDTIPLPEGFEIFSYNGQMYSLPTSYEDISQMGFVLEDEYDENDTFPEGFEELLTLYSEDRRMTAMIRINNYYETEIPLGKCQVDYFYIENPVAFYEDEKVPDLVFGDGLTLESTYEELVDYYGIPYYHYTDHSEEGYFYDSYEWSYYGEDEIQYVSITFWNDVISSVSLEKKPYEEKY